MIPLTLKLSLNRSTDNIIGMTSAEIMGIHFQLLWAISLKKSIGTARMIAAMERENRVASSHLMDREIVDRV